jgi:SIT4-associating protein SAP185/190
MILQSLFFDFPLNNFLHNVVYDIAQQILSGQFKPSTSRDLIVTLFTRAKLVEHILDAQRLNDTMR